MLTKLFGSVQLEDGQRHKFGRNWLNLRLDIFPSEHLTNDQKIQRHRDLCHKPGSTLTLKNEGTMDNYTDLCRLLIPPQHLPPHERKRGPPDSLSVLTSTISYVGASRVNSKKPYYR